MMACTSKVNNVLYVTLWIDFMINDIFVHVVCCIGCTSGREGLRRPSVNVKGPWSCFRKELSSVGSALFTEIWQPLNRHRDIWIEPLSISNR